MTLSRFPLPLLLVSVAALGWAGYQASVGAVVPSGSGLVAGSSVVSGASVVAGARETRRQIMLYTLVLAPLGLLLRGGPQPGAGADA